MLERCVRSSTISQLPTYPHIHKQAHTRQPSHRNTHASPPHTDARTTPPQQRTSVMRQPPSPTQPNPSQPPNPRTPPSHTTARTRPAPAMHLGHALLVLGRWGVVDARQALGVDHYAACSHSGRPRGGLRGGAGGGK